MIDNKDLLSDDELISIKRLLSDEEVQKILNQKFTIVISPSEKIVATTVEIEKVIGNNNLERILFNEYLNEERQIELISEQISIYIAIMLGVNKESISHVTKHETLQDATKKAMKNYIEAYVDYKTFLGIFRIQRKDIKLLKDCYVTIETAMIYIVLFNIVPDIFMGSYFLYLIGIGVSLLILINVARLSLKIWSSTFNEKDN